MSIKAQLSHVRLERGVWAGGVGLVIAGLSAMLAAQIALGWIGVGFGLALFVWGTTIHGQHLWEPWWRGPIRPYINAALMDFPYQEGTVINGIKWEPEFSHVNVRMANNSKEVISDLNFVVFLDRSIIKSACRSPFAKCSIGTDGGPVGQVTILGTDEQGNRVAIVGDQDQAIDIAPHHRIICAKLPSGASIDIDIATVKMGSFPQLPLWTRSNPTWIRLEGSYFVRGIRQTAGWYQPLGKAQYDVAGQVRPPTKGDGAR